MHEWEVNLCTTSLILKLYFQKPLLTRIAHSAHQSSTPTLFTKTTKIPHNSAHSLIANTHFAIIASNDSPSKREGGCKVIVTDIAYLVDCCP